MKPRSRESNVLDRWDSYVYESHSKETIINWALRMKLFRFFRAYGGHANDGDSVDVAIRYADSEDLISIFERIGIRYNRFTTKPEQAVPGTSYTGDEFSRFPRLIPGTRWIEQPCHTVLFGEEVFIWCDLGGIKISIGTGRYNVVEDDILVAERLEKRLMPLKLSYIDPPCRTRHYICPQYYPDLYDRMNGN
ncbi:hypothetical protein [Sediminispirochaeta smaragdinae]|uniref:Uncharacterized protein n=1 Tax=Sediminispirochaeta smaragdinae (strain DSM 11293 / JCM 15392 / SEBR 4228) TaxID=573413 RepID=E1R2N5_SEDSS|nr:hypothetical protein [Sediminispirochaeta smaragdinae]ADK80317.1 conserved hypothetical protein [Sediminispirochaeta smaragdinae DSM 11293]